MKKIYILGGATAIKLEDFFVQQLKEQNLQEDYEVELGLTNMTDDTSETVTNDVLDAYITGLIEKEDTKAIVSNIDLANLDGQLGRIRKERKDIFVVGLKTTENYDQKTQYMHGLEFLKNNSINLVLSNDTVNHRNMIVAPEETKYCETIDTDEVLSFLAKMTISRMQNKFTRSTVVEGTAVKWNSNEVPKNLREVVNHCIEAGAYKPFLGKTAGHFAVKVNEGEILTSIRKTNFNDLEKVGLVKVESKNDTQVIAHCFKPSVGGQSQRIIFKEHPHLDCIVHFHCPVKPEFKDTVVPVKQQWPNECGSHECGQNTSNGLREINIDGHKLSVVYLDEHGPNIVFNRHVPAKTVIDFIDKHFNLSEKTGGLVVEPI